jgi:hypothetical protein
MDEPGNTWSELTTQQLGRYAERFIQMEFTRLGFDVSTAEVDDEGIDFVIRTGKDSRPQHFDVQVKSARKNGLIVLGSRESPLRKNLLAAVVWFEEGRPPEPFLIPSLDLDEKQDGPLVHYLRHPPEARRSFNEYQISMTERNREALRNRYGFGKVADRIMAQAPARGVPPQRPKSRS